MQFSPCTRRCTQDGTHCQGCGRTHEEIAATRKMIVALANFANEMEYENVDVFAEFVANGLKFVVAEMRSQE